MIRYPTVLVIEDDPLVRFSITAYLEDSGFPCLEAEDGAQGLEMFQRGNIEIVVADLRMPRLDGFGVLAGLKTTSPGTPVILLTGLAEGDVAEAARAAGARLCLTKPLVDMEGLVAAILSLCPSVDSQGDVS